MTPLQRESTRARAQGRTRPALLRSVLLAVLLAGILFTILVLFAWWAQERIVFQPSEPPFPEHGETRRIEYTAEDGQPLFTFVVEPPADAQARLRDEREPAAATDPRDGG